MLCVPDLIHLFVNLLTPTGMSRLEITYFLATYQKSGKQATKMSKVPQREGVAMLVKLNTYFVV